MAFRKSTRRGRRASGYSGAKRARSVGHSRGYGGKRSRGVRRGGTTRIELIVRPDSPVNGVAAGLPLGMRVADPVRPKKPL